MQGDSNKGNRIHVFEFKFKNKFQKYSQFSIECQSIVHGEGAAKIKTKFCSKKKMDMLFAAKITNHWPMFLKEYIAKTKVDLK
jgi:hypothetical protein